MFVIFKVNNQPTCNQFENDIIKAGRSGPALKDPRVEGMTERHVFLSEDMNKINFGIYLDVPSRKDNTVKSYIKDGIWKSTIKNIIGQYREWQSRLTKLSKEL